MSARDRYIVANRLTHHVIEWEGDGALVLLLHGFLEHAHVWDFVAPHVVDGGYHVLALDWRGHGESQWIGAGGYYHFADYVADLAGIVRALGQPVRLVAHSMGGNVALLYAGTEPERVAALIAIEGIGPLDSDPAATPERFAVWVDDLERAARRPRTAIGIDDAVARLGERYPRLTPDALAHLARWGTCPAVGGRMWRFDPLHQTRSPQPYYVRQARAFWERVRCPVLYVEGDESPSRLPAEERDARLAALRAQRTTIAASGHHPHLEQPSALAQVIIEFLRRAG